MRPPPKKLDSADVLLWAAIDETVCPTGFCTHVVRGEELCPAGGLAICVYFDQVRQYYLFHCDASWRVLADTCHDTLELAQQQAEAEYAGVSALWRTRA